MFGKNQRSDAVFGRKLRVVRSALMAALLACVLSAFAAPHGAFAADDPVNRLAGSGRYGTMSEVVKASFPNNADAVVLASGEKFPDALSASALAGALKAPVVLTGYGDTLSPEAQKQIERLKPKRIIAIGADNSVSDGALAQAAKVAGDAATDRLEGAGRYDTSMAIAEELMATDGWGSGSANRVLFIATGEKYPDSLSASPYAYVTASPVLLCPTSGLNDKQLDVVRKLKAAGVSEAVILGGADGVPASVEKDLKEAGFTVSRKAGEGRYQTSIDFATWAIDRKVLKADNAIVATGENFPDALGGSALAGTRGSVLVLASDKNAEAVAYLGDTDADSATILGSTSSVPAQVEADLRTALQRGGGEEDPAPAPGDKPQEDLGSSGSVSYADNVVAGTGESWSVNEAGTKVTANNADIPGNVEPGSIVVLNPTEENPQGLALKVATIDRRGGKATVTGTAPDPLEMFNELKLSGEATQVISAIPEEGVEFVPNPAAANAAQNRAGDSVGFTLGELKIKEFEVAKGVKASGNVTLEGSIDYSIDMSWGKIKSAYVGASSQLKANGNISWDKSGSASAKSQKKLITLVLATPVPLVTINQSVFAEYSATGEAEFHYQTEVKAGVRYSDGRFSPEGSQDSSFDAKVNAKASVGVNYGIAVGIAGVPIVDASVGTGANFEGYAKTYENGLNDADLSAGIYANVAIRTM